jgi:hypothetical protein
MWYLIKIKTWIYYEALDVMQHRYYYSSQNAIAIKSTGSTTIPLAHIRRSFGTTFHCMSPASVVHGAAPM